MLFLGWVFGIAAPASPEYNAAKAILKAIYMVHVWFHEQIEQQLTDQLVPAEEGTRCVPCRTWGGQAGHM